MSAQKPVDVVDFAGTDAEVLREFIRLCREVKPVGLWPGERVCEAIERSMANERPFRFIAEADMAPERGHNGRGGDGDRVFSGPRRDAAVERLIDAAGAFFDGTNTWPIEAKLEQLRRAHGDVRGGAA